MRLAPLSIVNMPRAVAVRKIRIPKRFEKIIVINSKTVSIIIERCL